MMAPGYLNGDAVPGRYACRLQPTARWTCCYLVIISFLCSHQIFHPGRSSLISIFADDIPSSSSACMASAWETPNFSHQPAPQLPSIASHPNENNQSISVITMVTMGLRLPSQHVHARHSPWPHDSAPTALGLYSHTWVRSDHAAGRAHMAPHRS